MIRPLKLEENLYLVEWKYKDFLKIGNEFQGETIVKLEKIEYVSKEFVRVFTEKYDNHL
jgi:hypothetical protein